MKNIYRSKASIGAVACHLLFALPCSAQDVLEEVVITASRVETPLREVSVSLSVIDQQDIELRGYQTVADLMRTQPGIAVSNTGGQGKQTAIRIRGEESYRTLIVVDGLDVSDPAGTQSGPHAEHLMVSSEIEKIEILRGPQGLMYGADAGGVVNIRTRSGSQEFKSELSMELGRYDSQAVDVYVSGGSEHSDAFVSVSDTRTEGFDLNAATIANPENDGYENTTIHTKFGWNLSEQVRAQLVVRDTQSLNEFDKCGWGSSASNDCTGTFAQTAGRLSLDYRTPTIQHGFAIQNLDTARASFKQGVTDFSTQGETQKWEYIGSWSVTDVYDLGWGFDVDKEEIIDYKNNYYEREQKGVFAELRMNRNNAFYVTAGFRYDDNEDFGQHTSVRVGVAYIQELFNAYSVKYKSSYGTGFRAPSLGEIAYNKVEGPWLPALSEELSSGYDLGVELYHSKGFNAQVTYFNQMIEDEIGFDSVTWSGYEQKLGISHSKGLELALEVPVVKQVTVFANYTYNDTLTRDDEPRIRRPRNIANLGLKFSSEDEALNVLVSSRFVRDAIDSVYNAQTYSTDQVRLDDYRLVDISASYQLNHSLTVFARVENAGDEKYQEVTGYNVAEPAFYIGIRTSM